MTQMTVCNEKQILSVRLYNDFQHAFSDAMNGDSDIHAYLEEQGFGVKAGEPERIYAGGTKKDGYDDDFHIRYPNGVIIILGDIFIEEDRYNARRNA